MEKEQGVEISKKNEADEEAEAIAEDWEKHKAKAEALIATKKHKDDFPNDKHEVISENTTEDLGNVFDDAIEKYIKWRDSDEPATPATFSRDEIASTFFEQFHIKKREFSTKDKIFNRKEYKKYLSEMKYFDGLIDRECEWQRRSLDELAVVPVELVDMLKTVVDNPNYTLAIHMSSFVDGANYKNDKILHNIMRKGLINSGDASFGVFYKDPPLHRTVSFCYSQMDIKKRLTNVYKGSTGEIILAFPNKYINADGSIKKGMESKIYDYDEHGNSVIRPEFILGFAQNLGKGTLVEYRTRKELLDGYNSK